MVRLVRDRRVRSAEPAEEVDSEPDVAEDNAIALEPTAGIADSGRSSRRQPARSSRDAEAEEAKASEDLLSVTLASRRKKRRKDPRPGLRVVNIGLGCHYAKLLLILLTILLNVIAAAAGAAGNLGLYVTMSVISNSLSWFINPVLGIVGSILCCLAPARSGKGLIIASLVCDVLPIFLGLLTLAGVLAAGSGAVKEFTIIALVFLGIALLLSVLAWILFMCFLSRLAAYLKETGSSQEASDLILYGLAIAVLPMIILFPVILMLAHPGLSCLALGLLPPLLLIWAFYGARFMIRLLNLISTIRGAIAWNC
jgi:hypothetical protein